MKLQFRITNRALLRLGLNVSGNVWSLHCEASDLPHDARQMLADRLHEDSFVCAGQANEHGQVEPKFDEDGLPELLRVDGTEVQDLVAAVRLDQREVEAEWANLVVAAEG